MIGRIGDWDRVNRAALVGISRRIALSGSVDGIGSSSGRLLFGGSTGWFILLNRFWRVRG